MDMKINTEALKTLRKERVWSQDELAVASSLSLRTIQRVEKDGNASLESIKAIASAFKIEPNDLSVDAATSAVADEDAERFYFRVENGTALVEIIGGTYAFRINHDEPETEEEADLVASAAQSIQDWGEIWSDLEAGDRVKAAFNLSSIIEELEESGFWVFGLRTTEEYRGITTWPVANVFVMKSSNPRIIKLDMTDVG